MGKDVFLNMATDLVSDTIDNQILVNSIRVDNYEQWQKQFTWDALKNHRYGQSFCNYFGITDHRIFYETNWETCDAVIRREWIERS
jgi:hypothetical protein